MWVRLMNSCLYIMTWMPLSVFWEMWLTPNMLPSLITNQSRRKIFPSRNGKSRKISMTCRNLILYVQIPMPIGQIVRILKVCVPFLCLLKNGSCIRIFFCIKTLWVVIRSQRTRIWNFGDRLVMR